MKTLLTGIAFIFAVAVIHAAGNDRTKTGSDNMRMSYYTDTLPSDTTKKDTTLQYGLLSYNITDTVPKDTTTKDTMFASAVAYRSVRDTLPTDTTKKDTTFQALALNR